jgi:hypothetical protein
VGPNYHTPSSYLKNISNFVFLWERVGGGGEENDSWQSDHGPHPKTMSIYVYFFRREMIVGNPIMYESVNHLLREDIFTRCLGDKNSFVVAQARYCHEDEPKPLHPI